mgnify:FL=1
MMTSKKIIIPLPNSDFDPSEVAIPWQLLRQHGFIVFFATPDGNQARADEMMLSGEGLDVWGWLPVIKKVRLIGLLLRANKAARDAHQALVNDSHFQNPCSYAALKVENFDGLILPGGHAQGIKPYLESKTLQAFVAAFFEDKSFKASKLNNSEPTIQHKPIAAVCHGVLVAARAISPSTQKSVLYGKKTTALTWALENSAWKLIKYFARFWDASYYRTYTESNDEPEGYWGVEQEIKRALKHESDFLDVPKNVPYYAMKTSGVLRDSIKSTKPAWIVQDGNYFSARWPGDIFTLTLLFIKQFDK